MRAIHGVAGCRYKIELVRKRSETPTGEEEADRRGERHFLPLAAEKEAFFKIITRRDQCRQPVLMKGALPWKSGETIGPSPGLTHVPGAADE